MILSIIQIRLNLSGTKYNSDFGTHFKSSTDLKCNIHILHTKKFKHDKVTHSGIAQGCQDIRYILN